MSAQVDSSGPAVSFSFQREEPLGPAIERIRAELLDSTLAALEHLEPNHDQNIHDARRQLKKLRGVLRLVRGSIEPAAYERDNACFRDVGRSLAEAREAAATLECVEALLAHYDDRIPRREFSAIERALGAQRAETVARVGETSTVARALEELRSARGPDRAWTLTGEDFELIRAGLFATYRGARRACRRASRTSSSENFHELRKLSKYHLHHVRLLEPVFVLELRARRRALDALNEALGHLHDLDMLRALLDREKLESVPLLQRLAFSALVDQRRREVALDAELQAARLYAEKPRALAKRLRSYFELWRAPSPPISEDAPHDGEPAPNTVQPPSRSITA